MPATHIIVTRAEAGQKIVRFLERRLPGVPRSALMRWLRTGQVRLDSRRCKPFVLVAEGQDVRIPPFLPEESQPPVPHGVPPLEIIFQDRDMLAVNKPAGLPSQPGTGHADSVATRLRAMFADADFIPAPVHRLDRDTTGVLLAGTTHAALKQLSRDFAQSRIRKTYLAWVRGIWPHTGEMLLEDSLEKQGMPGREKVVAHAVEGKTALARVRAIGFREGRIPATLLSVELLTGRTHQIRVQLASRGFPLVGDGKYGGPSCDLGLLLHAAHVLLPDGRTISAPAPWMGQWTVDAVPR